MPANNITKRYVSKKKCHFNTSSLNLHPHPWSYIQPNGRLQMALLLWIGLFSCDTVCMARRIWIGVHVLFTALMAPRSGPWAFGCGRQATGCRSPADWWRLGTRTVRRDRENSKHSGSGIVAYPRKSKNKQSDIRIQTFPGCKRDNIEGLLFWGFLWPSTLLQAMIPKGPQFFRFPAQLKNLPLLLMPVFRWGVPTVIPGSPHLNPEHTQTLLISNHGIGPGLHEARRGMSPEIKGTEAPNSGMAHSDWFLGRTQNENLKELLKVSDVKVITTIINNNIILHNK